MPHSLPRQLSADSAAVNEPQKPPFKPIYLVNDLASADKNVCPTLHQLANRLSPRLNQVLRPAPEIKFARLQIEAGFCVERGKYLLKLDRPLDRMLGVFVRGADDLTRRHSAAGEHGCVGLRPVIAAVPVVQPRCATKLAPYD